MFQAAFALLTHYLAQLEDCIKRMHGPARVHPAVPNLLFACAHNASKSGYNFLQTGYQQNVQNCMR